MKLEKEGLVVTPLTEQKTGLWDMAFIWFCANVAVPRLMIGGSLAGLGFGKLILILLAGNILVFLPLLALGIIGYNVRIPTMAATRMTFGVKGSYLPSVANGIQLLGWGANVTVICGSSINSIIYAMTGYSNLTLWIIVTGIVQLVITAYGVRSITWLQRVSVPLLAILTVVAAVLIIKNYGWRSAGRSGYRSRQRLCLGPHGLRLHPLCQEQSFLQLGHPYRFSGRCCGLHVRRCYLLYDHRQRQPC